MSGSNFVQLENVKECLDEWSHRQEEGPEAGVNCNIISVLIITHNPKVGQARELLLNTEQIASLRSQKSVEFQINSGCWFSLSETSRKSYQTRLLHWLGGDQTFNKADRGSYAAAYMEVKLMVTSTNNNQWPTTYPLYGRIWTLTPGITLKEVIWKCSKWFGLLMSNRTGSQRCSNVQIRSKSKFGFLCLPSHVIGSWLVRLMFQQIYLQGAMQYRDRLQRRWTLW